MPDGSDGVSRLPDPRPADGAKVPGGWWPPVMLDIDWIRANRACFDVFHVHFGFDAKQPAELLAIAGTPQELGVPLVFTVHDLRNPHHEDVELHDAQLEVLVSHAAAVVTLTAGAAAEVARRWDRDAVVLAHPHVVELEDIGTDRVQGDRFVIGLHAKSVRANMDVLGVAQVLARAVAQLPSAVLRIDVHDEIFDPAGHWYAPDVGQRLRALATNDDRVELREHAYFTDDELWGYFLELDVSVLPYRNDGSRAARCRARYFPRING
jgi:hypothetical protein